ncbi:CheR family methyltransferase [Evansella cellulosilytica]|uniref:protein-glutamate O-methyltransferase n=1 Tax=Evansella cellulosilytica (strain ATCC 21833 / DSM 2522 / FERM P-1141 / JCM 9156 / N-4) TaxID=649639 RepID=E6TZG0_EVAC2|nr:protein-glutamate O-methyltransferase CheR [Evansella cellulosilytica]ADU30134.1 MCP methyltransferase, CheR-type [Evansella cellulosilytica DSM 2522]
MSDYERFIDGIKQLTGIDLSLYKEGQMKRRLTTLRDKRGFHSFLDYYHSLIKDKELFEEFLQRMTINVSEFYRNPKRWEVLEDKILPNLIQQDKKFKAWSAACSTGEEPYTLSMILQQKIPLNNIDILATDLDTFILERAKVGFYTDRSIKDVPNKMLSNYFEKDDIGYKVKDSVKKPITFTRQNLLADTFGSNYDLIICRNVMIYFTEEAKDILYKKFSAALKPGGILFVGSTEQIFNPQQYQFVSEDTFFYKKAL